MTEGTNVPKSKAPGVVWLRHLIEQKGPEAEQAMAKALSPDDYKAYCTALPLTWITEETITRIFRSAGDILFSDAPSPLIETGRGMAKAHMTGVYKFMLRMTTIPFIISRASSLWRTLHDTGDAEAGEVPGERTVTFTVRGCPSLPADMRQLLRGYITGLGELTGARNVRTEADESDPDAWRWRCSWE